MLLRTLGNRLIDLSDRVLQQTEPFLTQYNRAFSKVQLNCFKFGGVYTEMVCKEVDEIGKIFVHYGIPIN